MNFCNCGSILVPTGHGEMKCPICGRIRPRKEQALIINKHKLKPTNSENDIDIDSIKPAKIKKRYKTFLNNLEQGKGLEKS